jgi:hypothetical protein
MLLSGMRTTVGLEIFPDMWSLANDARPGSKGRE